MRSDENDRRIRNRFIRSLGIIEDSPTSTELLMLRKNGKNKTSSCSVNVLSQATLEVPLKDHCSSRRRRRWNQWGDAAAEDSKEQQPRYLDASHNTRIQFNSVVQVKTIPSHFDYSDRVRRHLWSNRHELRESTQRNMREFAFEGWNVRGVIEEDDMFFDRRSLEFVHPAHVACGAGYYRY